MMTYLLCLFSFTDEFIQLIVTRGNEVASKIFTSVIGLSFFRNKFTVRRNITAIFFNAEAKYCKESNSYQRRCFQFREDYG